MINGLSFILRLFAFHFPHAHSTIQAGEWINHPESESKKDDIDEEESELQQEYDEYERRMERTAVLFQILNGIKEGIRERTKKRPDDIINGYKARKINRILSEIRERYEGSDYDDLLELIEEPREEEQDGKTVITGMTYSDAGVVLEHYAAITRFIKIKKT